MDKIDKVTSDEDRAISYKEAYETISPLYEEIIQQNIELQKQLQSSMSLVAILLKKQGGQAFVSMNDIATVIPEFYEIKISKAPNGDVSYRLAKTAKGKILEGVRQ